MITPAQCRAARALELATDDAVIDQWHRWNDYLAELDRSGLSSRVGIKMRGQAETELERRGILIPGKRA